MSARPSNRPPPSEAHGGDESQAPHVPPAPHAPHPPHAPHAPEHDPRTTIERILPELIRRGLEVGREKVSESLPREFAAQVVSQIGDVRSGIVKAVALEVGRFLREADIASELRKVLIGLNVEAQVKLKFSKRDDGSLKPEVDVTMGSDERTPKRPAK